MSTPNPALPSSQLRDRVFVSYSHLDAQWLDKLRDYLQPDIRNGRIDFRDDRNLVAGDDWYREIAGYIAHARVAVLLVSPNFLASSFIMEKELPLILEAKRQAEAEGQGLTILWVPLSGTYYGPNAVPGAERVTRFQAVWEANQPLDAFPEKSRAEHLLDLCKQISRLVNPAPHPNNLPFTPLGKLLKGREGDLARLDGQLRLHGSSAIVQPQAVSGPGGIGKTRLAVEYARRHEGDFTALLFVSAGSPSDLHTNMARLSASDGALDLTEYKSASEEEQYAAVILWLQQNKGWLLILDNVDTKEAVAAVQKLVAKLTGGHVLVTSRITMWGGGIPRFPLDVLSPDAAVELLLEKANSLPRTPRPDDAEQARLLAEQLGYLPLALTHAAAYVGESDLAFDDYMREFDDALQFHEEEVIEYDPEYALDPAAVKILKTVATTYFMSIDRLGPVEKAILRAASFLAPAPIPIAMFAESPDEMKALVELWCEETAEPGDSKPVRDAVKELVRYSLIERNTDLFTIHRMERLVLRAKVSKDRAPNWIEATRAALIHYAPDETAENPSTWPVWDLLRPHAEALVNLAKADNRVKPNLDLLNALGNLYYGKGLYAQNRLIDEFALEIALQTHGDASSEYADRLMNYGETLRVLGEYSKAEAAFRSALAIREIQNGPSSKPVAESLNYVAISIGRQGRAGETEELLRRALAIYEKDPDSNKGGLCKVLNNLGNVLIGKGSLDQAEAYCTRSHSLYEETYGSDHPLTLIGASNLAGIYQRKKDYATAESMYRRLLEATERVLGPEHPNTLDRASNLAHLLQEKGDNAAAELLHRRVLEARERVLGLEHPDTLASMEILADLLKAKGDLAGAEPLYSRLLDARDRVLGPNHPDTLSAVNNLANLFQAKGDTAAAEPFFRRALEAKRNDGNTEQPEFAVDLNNHALLLRKQKRYDEADEFLQRAIGIDDRVTPPDSPVHAHRRNNLAIVYMLANRLEEAMRRNAEAWTRKASLIDVTTGRILFARVALCWLQNADASLYSGQLRTLLSQPDLPCMGNIIRQWDAADILDELHSRLTPEQADFLAALVAALNEPSKAADLERFDLWRSATPLPLDTPWPDGL